MSRPFYNYCQKRYQVETGWTNSFFFYYELTNGLIILPTKNNLALSNLGSKSNYLLKSFISSNLGNK